MIKIHRSSEIYESPRLALLSLTSIKHYPGQLIQSRYWTNPEHTELSSVFAIGTKEGTGDDCFEVVSLGSKEVVTKITEELPDVSSLVHGETYIWQHDGKIYRVYRSLQTNGRKIDEVTEESGKYLNIADGYTWYLKKGKLFREDENPDIKEVGDSFEKKLSEFKKTAVEKVKDDFRDTLDEINSRISGVISLPKTETSPFNTISRRPNFTTERECIYIVGEDVILKTTDNEGNIVLTKIIDGGSVHKSIYLPDGQFKKEVKESLGSTWEGQTATIKVSGSATSFTIPFVTATNSGLLSSEEYNLLKPFLSEHTNPETLKENIETLSNGPISKTIQDKVKDLTNGEDWRLVKVDKEGGYRLNPEILTLPGTSIQGVIILDKFSRSIAKENDALELYSSDENKYIPVLRVVDNEIKEIAIGKVGVDGTVLSLNTKWKIYEGLTKETLARTPLFIDSITSRIYSQFEPSKLKDITTGILSIGETEGTTFEGNRGKALEEKTEKLAGLVEGRIKRLTANNTEELKSAILSLPFDVDTDKNTDAFIGTDDLSTRVSKFNYIKDLGQIRVTHIIYSLTGNQVLERVWDTGTKKEVSNSGWTEFKEGTKTLIWENGKIVLKNNGEKITEVAIPEAISSEGVSGLISGSDIKKLWPILDPSVDQEKLKVTLSNLAKGKISQGEGAEENSTGGNTININSIQDGSHTIETAPSYVVKVLRKTGKKITFRNSSGSWETWTFIGDTIDSWENTENWKSEVTGVSIDGERTYTPDSSGIITLPKFLTPRNVDDTPSSSSKNPISSKGVYDKLDELKKQSAASLYVDEEENKLILRDTEGRDLSFIILPKGGGNGEGGGFAPTFVLDIKLLSENKVIKLGDNYLLRFNWKHYNLQTQRKSSYNGRAEVIVNGSPVLVKEVDQGDVEVEIDKYLGSGENKVVVRVIAADKTTEQSPTLLVTAVILKLTSEYNLSTVTRKGEVLPFRFTVQGSGNKTVTFEVDGQPLGESMIVSTSGAVSIKNLSTTNLSHGAHHLKVSVSRESSGGLMKGDDLHTDFIVYDPASSSSVIATQESEVEINQYETLLIPFFVFSPGSQESSTRQVEVFIDNVKVSDLSVGNERGLFSYKVLRPNNFTVRFVSAGSEKVVNVRVIAAETQVTMATDGLDLYLKSSGRSNNDLNKDVWEWKQVRASFNDKIRFDESSGWVADKNGISSLHLSKGGKVTIPYKPFSVDGKVLGKTVEIEFKVSNAFDYNTPLIDCLDNIGFRVTAQECFFQSSQGKKVSTKFKQNERIRVTFIVSANGFMYLFLNGELSNVIKYTSTDYFIQTVPQDITIGSDSAEIDVYSILAYNTSLSFRQVVNNYISSLDNTEEMIRKIKENSIVNEDSGEEEIEYNKVLPSIPCMTVIGTLPTYKGDKKTVKIIYEDTKRPEFSFVCDKMQIDVQGTSSQYYPRKNWKIKSKSGFRSSLTGKVSSKYALHGIDGVGKDIDMKPVKTFCMKADFAESSGTHNTGAANFINEVLVKSGILTPPQKVDKTVRTTVYGFPCLMFHQESETSEKKFIGKYNFNNDKSTQDVFGFEGIKGYNKGMVNRDSWLFWFGTYDELIVSKKALEDAVDGDDKLSYLLQKPGDPNHNHYYSYENNKWVDKGEMWRWDYESRSWKNNAGQSTKDGLKKAESGELVENNVECWEFTNNGNAMGLFHDSDFNRTVKGSDIPRWTKTKWLRSDVLGEKLAPYWSTAFEPRYPDCDDLNKAYSTQKIIPVQLKAVVEWLRSVDIFEPGIDEGEKLKREAEFKKNFTKYFHKDTLLAYDLIREGLLMADQGAKNMMWAFFDGLCYPIFYDNDTILGLNNEGRNQFSPYVEPHSKDDIGKFVFNGESSVLWNLIEKTEERDKDQLYQTLVATGDFTYKRALYWFNTRQSDYWSETVYNLDSKFKYIDSFGVAGEGDGIAQDYLDIAQGSREEHRKWMLFERLSYVNAKRASGDYRNNFVHLRANTAGSSSVPHEVAISVTAAQDWYFGFRFSGNAGFSSKFIGKDQTYKFTAPPGSNPNDTECYVHQADRVKDLGDLSKLYPSTLVVPECRRLKRLIVGNETPGYIGKLATLTLGYHPELEEINIANCPNLTTVLDLSGCQSIKRIEAKGSNIKGVKLPAGSEITYLSLPDSITSLELFGFSELTLEGLKINNYSRIESFNASGYNKIDTIILLNNISLSENSSLRYVRIENLNLTGTGKDLLSIAKRGLRGYNDRTGKPEILGTYTLTRYMTESEVELVKRELPGIRLVNAEKEYTILEIDDNTELAARLSNLDNRTGYKFQNEYKPSGEIIKIFERRIPCVVRKHEETGKVYACKVNRKNMLEYEDGHEVKCETYDPNRDGDLMIYEPTYYYKGINDLLSNKRYMVYSSQLEEPKDESKDSTIINLSDIPRKWDNKKLVTTETRLTVGSLFNLENNLVDNARSESVSVSNPIISELRFLKEYRYRPNESDVYELTIPEGTKLIRWPSTINGDGSVFINKDNIITKLVKTDGVYSVSKYGYIEEGSYVFTEVPEGSTKLYFTAPRTWWNDFTAEKICVISKSDNVVSIEPQWIRHEAELVSSAGSSPDGNRVPRSGVPSRTNEAWDLKGRINKSYIETREFLEKSLKPGFRMEDYETMKDRVNFIASIIGSLSISDKSGFISAVEDKKESIKEYYTLVGIDDYSVKSTAVSANNNTGNLYYPGIKLTDGNIRVKQENGFILGYLRRSSHYNYPPGGLRFSGTYNYVINDSLGERSARRYQYGRSDYYDKGTYKTRELWTPFEQNWNRSSGITRTSHGLRMDIFATKSTVSEIFQYSDNKNYGSSSCSFYFDGSENDKYAERSGIVLGDNSLWRYSQSGVTKRGTPPPGHLLACLIRLTFRGPIEWIGSSREFITRGTEE